jgi:hypothetical protein
MWLLDKQDVVKVYSELLPKALNNISFRYLHSGMHGIEGPAKGYMLPHQFGWQLLRVKASYYTREAPESVFQLIKMAGEMGLTIDGPLKILEQRARAERYARKPYWLFTDNIFQRFFIPFVQTLCNELHEIKDKRSPTPAEIACVDGILEAYLASDVGSRPMIPTDWKRDYSGTCACTDCQGLRQFVTSPDRAIGEFRMAGNRRKHLENTLDSTFRTRTNKNTPIPYALVVEKTFKSYELERMEWEKRADVARTHLSKLVRSNHLVSIIGGDRYRTLIDHENIRPDYVLATSTTETNVQRLNDTRRGNNTLPPSTTTLKDPHPPGVAIKIEPDENTSPSSLSHASATSTSIPVKRQFSEFDRD